MIQIKEKLESNCSFLSIDVLLKIIGLRNLQKFYQCIKNIKK